MQKKKKKKKETYCFGARLQWLRLIILATQEAEIRKISVQNQPQANSS
jgi:hypothetical protein